VHPLVLGVVGDQIVEGAAHRAGMIAALVAFGMA